MQDKLIVWWVTTSKRMSNILMSLFLVSQATHTWITIEMQCGPILDHDPPFISTVIS